jgi:hypothetical protein
MDIERHMWLGDRGWRARAADLLLASAAEEQDQQVQRWRSLGQSEVLESSTHDY